jgi:hypothetical protein
MAQGRRKPARARFRDAVSPPSPRQYGARPGCTGGRFLLSSFAAAKPFSNNSREPPNAKFLPSAEKIDVLCSKSVRTRTQETTPVAMELKFSSVFLQIPKWRYSRRHSSSRFDCQRRTLLALGDIGHDHVFAIDADTRKQAERAGDGVERAHIRNPLTDNA